MLVCPKCNYNLEIDHNFCPSCGYDLRELKDQAARDEQDQQEQNLQIAEKEISGNVEFVLCDVCGEETKNGSGYCGSCGAKLTGNEKKVTGSAPAVTPGTIYSRQEKVESRENKAKLENAQNKNVEALKKGTSKRADTVASGQIKPKNPQTKKVKTPSGGRIDQKSIKPLHLGIFIFSLVAVGFLILYLSGVFDSHEPAAAQNNFPQQQESSINLQDVQRMNDLENSVKKDTTNLGTVLELAHLLNDSGLDERAIPYYQMYLRANPKNVDVLVDLGVSYFELKQYDNAKVFMRRGWNINPRHQIANFNLGIVNFSAGSIDSAKIWWQKAIEIDPTSEIGKKAKELLDSH